MTEPINVKQSRFRDASWFEKINNLTIPIVIGGVGGIGSWLALFLARTLPRTSHLFLYDHDNVEEVNMAGQFYESTHIRMLKVRAAQNVILRFSGFGRISAQAERYVKESLASPIMFSAFDNMEARKVMFENWAAESKKHEESIFIDGRLLAEQLQVFFVTPETAERYQKDHLFDDSEVEDANCSYKQTTHFAATIAAKMVQGFTNWLAGDAAVVPFYYEEVGSLFLTTIED